MVNHLQHSLLCWGYAVMLGCIPPVALAQEAVEVQEVQAIQAELADLLIVVGAGGEPQYQSLFDEWATLLVQVGQQADARVSLIGPEPNQDMPTETVRDQVRERLKTLAQASSRPLWLALIGHGTYDGRLARFNVRGPDISESDLAEWLSDIKRPLAVINTSSASAPFIKRLSGPNRVILTATRDGFELNFARFGSYLVEALGSESADLDKDGQTSLLEAFIIASKQTGAFYEIEGRLASEHALLDDTGDAKGTPAEWFRGTRLVKESSDASMPDGRRASQFHLIESELEKRLSPASRKQRDALEQAIHELRDRRDTMPMETYLDQLEALLVPMAELYQAVSEGLIDSPEVE